MLHVLFEVFVTFHYNLWKTFVFTCQNITKYIFSYFHKSCLDGSIHIILNDMKIYHWQATNNLPCSIYSKFRRFFYFDLNEIKMNALSNFCYKIWNRYTYNISFVIICSLSLTWVYMYPPHLLNLYIILTWMVHY